MNVVNRHWAPLSLADVQALLKHYGDALAPQVIEWHSDRPFSSAAIVRTASRPVFVKRHAAAIRTPAQLSEEHGYMGWLARHAVPVSTVLLTSNGTTAVGRDGWTYEVHELAAGIDLYRETPSWEPFTSVAHARSAGAMLGRVHRAAYGYHAPARGAHVLVSKCGILRTPDPIGLMETYRQQRHGLARYFSGRSWQAQVREVLRPWHDAILPLLGQVPALWTHNDWHASNLLWDARNRDAGVCAVLDFGLADLTNASFDLATAIERNAIPWLDIQAGVCAEADLELVGAILDGYLDEHPLTLAERRLVAAILPVVHVEFALAEVDYYAGLVDDAAYADLAYEDFLIGHAQWFSSAAGTRLLRYLRESLHDGRH
jgi:Ser/Thr protein kinase RdoA (MazF antagonist)